MNCLDYRRALGADPRHEAAEMTTHRRECAACAQAQARALGQELELRRALDVPVPAGLADRILLAQTTSMRVHHRHRRGISASVAAAAVLALAAVGAGWWALRAQSLAPLVVDHIAREPEAFAAHPLLDAPTLREHFAERGVMLATDPPSGVGYAANCPVGAYKSVHMVMSERNGPVTVFYLAGHREQARTEFSEEDLRGRVVPMGEGTLVLVARSGDGFDAIERDWRRSIEGPLKTVADTR